ncbi:MAG: ATP-dependent zinc metalloprotease FtsH [Thermodesulfobacteriota bacterium]
MSDNETTDTIFLIISNDFNRYDWHITCDIHIIKMSSKNIDKSDDTKNSSPFLSIWFFIFVVISIMLISRYLSDFEPVTEIPYTQFIKELKVDNIEKIKIDNDEINGVFLQPFTPSSKKESVLETKLFKERPESFKNFKTVYPVSIGDSNLIGLLEKHDVTIEVESSSKNLIITILSWAPFVLLFLFLLWMSNNMARGQGSAFSFGRSGARKYGSNQSDVTFDDVAGADEAKAQLQQEVDFLTNPKKYHDIGAKIPRGILLVGLPGTGKTLLAKAVAGEAGVPFFSISASEFVEMFVGVGASRVRDLFKQGKENAPSIVFIDELDAVARRRGAGMGTVNDEREQTLNQLLVEMDGFDERQEVIILAATNRPDVLDPALLRPGRFDRQVILGLPDKKGREGILKIHSRKLKLASDIDFSLLARTSIGMSGADIANLCNEAALTASNKNHKSVEIVDFEEAFDKVLLGEKRKLFLNEKQREVIAYHEAGHAVAAWFIPEADEVHKVTIIPHGQALGVTQQLPVEDQYNLSRSYLTARIAVLLGGRVSEEIARGDITTGAENDLIEATKLARKMVTRWGMSNLGLLAFGSDDEHPFLGYELARGKDFSEKTASLIDNEVNNLLDESHDKVYEILKSNKRKLDLLANLLLNEETVDKENLVKVLGPRPQFAVVYKANTI